MKTKQEMVDLIKWHIGQIKELSGQTDTSVDVVFVTLTGGVENGDSVAQGFNNGHPDFLAFCAKSLFGQLPLTHQMMFLIDLMDMCPEDGVPSEMADGTKVH